MKSKTSYQRLMNVQHKRVLTWTTNVWNQRLIFAIKVKRLKLSNILLEVGRRWYRQPPLLETACPTMLRNLWYSLIRENFQESWPLTKEDRTKKLKKLRFTLLMVISNCDSWRFKNFRNDGIWVKISGLHNQIYTKKIQATVTNFKEKPNLTQDMWQR